VLPGPSFEGMREVRVALVGNQANLEDLRMAFRDDCRNNQRVSTIYQDYAVTHAVTLLT